mgnify:FL=1|tara:strand:+ start:416 stop:1096 length:681 start_codon:yes stop_codon:yes gene_type:complete
MKHKLIISGATGKMGLSLKECLNEFLDFELVYSASSKELEIPNASMIIDFSESSFSIEILKQAVEKRIPMLIGTTGFNNEQKEEIESSSNYIPILLAPNTSLGIYSLKRMIKELLPFISETTIISIEETHHKNKKDSPSGTALDLENFIQEEFSLTNNISIKSNRIEDLSGSHSLSFINNNEEIQISHKSLNRKVYSEGAFIAARWLLGQGPGLYEISDIYLSKTP